MNALRHTLWARCAVVGAACGLLTTTAVAQGFAASVSPPRVEVRAKAGSVQRHVIDINHTAPTAGSYRIYTNDWVMQPDGSVSFSQPLAPGSCRPWVALERADLTIKAASKYRYRFEVKVPPETPDGECRFAILVEGLEPVQMEQAGLTVPISGRLAVVVYVVVGDAKPNLSITSHAVAMVNGQKMPTIVVRNQGFAHGRLDGLIEGVDAAGAKIEFLPSNGPILPGYSSTISFEQALEQGKKPVEVRYPLKLRGQLEAGRVRIPVDLEFAN